MEASPFPVIGQSQGRLFPIIPHFFGIALEFNPGEEVNRAVGRASLKWTRELFMRVAE
jgi:hypothetical protein